MSKSGPKDTCVFLPTIAKFLMKYLQTRSRNTCEARDGPSMSTHSVSPKCIIHINFSLNPAWPYDWSESCNLINQLDIIAPISFSLNQNYPNPFNPYTTLNYELPEDSFVEITVYDMLGNIVNTLVNANQSSGYKSVQWNATNNQGEPVSAGVYLYKIQVGDFVDARKMILLK